MNYDQAKRNCSEMGSQVIEFENGQELNEVSSEFANTSCWSPARFLTLILDCHMDELETLLDWTS